MCLWSNLDTKPSNAPSAISGTTPAAAPVLSAVEFAGPTNTLKTTIQPAAQL